MNKNYYVEYFELERKHWWFRVREGIISDTLKRFVGRKEPLQILNIGAATGRSTEMLSRYGKVTSIENDKDCCDFVNERLNLGVLNASVLELPFADRSFDLVCAFDVIEHVEDDSKAVQEMERVCKSNGFLYITVPAFMTLWSQHDVVNHHLRRYRMGSLTKLFGGLVGKTVFKTYFNSILLPPIFAFRVLSKLFGFRNRKGAGSDFSLVNEKSFVNKVLFGIFSFERSLMKSITFPAGVSILYLWEKK